MAIHTIKLDRPLLEILPIPECINGAAPQRLPPSLALGSSFPGRSLCRLEGLLRLKGGHSRYGDVVGTDASVMHGPLVLPPYEMFEMESTAATDAAGVLFQAVMDLVVKVAFASPARDVLGSFNRARFGCFKVAFCG